MKLGTALESLVLDTLRALAEAQRACDSSFHVEGTEEEKRRAWQDAAAAREEAVSRLTHLSQGLFPAKLRNASTQRKRSTKAKVTS